ncbi:MAG TPA: NUDIX domain-containing protein [Ornithinibacter sp.]|nr:NUDIX domain-containing protein [Ornithinibacter sp.]
MAGRSDPLPFHVACDVVVLSVRSGVLQAMVVRREEQPYAGRPALPGGFVRAGEDLADAAYRELASVAGIGRGDVILEQLAAYGAPGRDPRFRVVTVAWLALGAGLPELSSGRDVAVVAEWVPVLEALGASGSRSGPGGGNGGGVVGNRNGNGIAGGAGRRVLALDHGRILADGVERARATLEDTGFAAALCGETFTVADLHAVYEAVWGIELDRANFHRKVTGVAGFLTPTGEMREGGRGRPARVYRGDPRAMLSPPILRGDR